MRFFGIFCTVMAFLTGAVLLVVGFTQGPWVVWEIIGGAILIALVVVIVALLLIDGKKSKTDQR